jgi:transcriptional regulator with XRE-family HTH domain
MVGSMGKEITTIREAKKWTRYKLHKMSGVAYSFITLLEQDKCPNISFKNLAKVCKALGISTAQFEKYIE